jgi:hypothetical protein
LSRFCRIAHAVDILTKLVSNAPYGTLTRSLANHFLPQVAAKRGSDGINIVLLKTRRALKFAMRMTFLLLSNIDGKGRTHWTLLLQAHDGLILSANMQKWKFHADRGEQ